MPWTDEVPEEEGWYWARVVDATGPEVNRAVIQVTSNGCFCAGLGWTTMSTEMIRGFEFHHEPGEKPRPIPMPEEE